MNKFHNACRSTRKEIIIPYHNCTDIYGMKCVNILNRVNKIDNLFIIKMLRKRKLAQNAADFLFIVKFFYKII